MYLEERVPGNLLTSCDAVLWQLSILYYQCDCSQMSDFCVNFCGFSTNYTNYAIIQPGTLNCATCQNNGKAALLILSGFM